MTDRELWVRTWKTAGAMVGGTVLLLGSLSLVLLLSGGRPAAGVQAEGNPASSAVPGANVNAKEAAPALPIVPKGPRHSVAASGRPGESI